MHLEIVKIHNVLFIKPLVKQVKLANYSEFKAKLLAALPSKQTSVVFDLSEIEELDSCFIGSMISVGLKAIYQTGNKPGLCNIRNEVKSVFRFTHIDQLFAIFETREHASEALTTTRSHAREVPYIGSSSNVFQLLQIQTLDGIALCYFDSPEQFSLADTKNEILAIFVEEMFLDSALTSRIRSKTGCKQSLIIGLVKSTLDHPSNSDFINKYGINKVIQTPFTEEQAHGIMQGIEGLKVGHEDNEHRLPNKLFENYLSSITDKIDQMNRLAENLSMNLTMKSVEDLRFQTHKIAGSAGTYGFSQAGEKCKEFTSFLDNLLVKQNIEKSVVNDIKEWISKIKFYFDIVFSPNTSRRNLAIAPVKKRHLLVVSQDHNFIDILQTASDILKLQMTSVKDPSEVIDNIKALKHKPEVVLIDKSFKENEDSTSHMVEEIKQILSTNQVNYWMAIENDQIEEHIDALKQGVDFTINKPISIDAIVEFFNKHLCDEKRGMYKVLIVDDDKDMCDYCQTTLGEVGIDVGVLMDGTRILETLDQYQPHLLLLDVHLPTYDGWTLLKILFHDIRYERLKVIVITGSHKIEKKDLEQPFYDEIWYKPFDKHEFQNRVRRLAEIEFKKHQIPPHVVSTYKPRQEFESLFHTMLNLNKDQKIKPFYLVVIKSLDFRRNFEEKLRKNFLIECEITIDRFVKADVLKGYLGDGFFGLFMGFITKEEVLRLINDFIIESEYRIIIHAEENIFTTFSALLVHCTEVPDKISRLIEFSTDYFDKTTVLPSEIREIEYDSNTNIDENKALTYVKI